MMNFFKKLEFVTRWRVPETASPVDQLHYQVVNTVSFIFLMVCGLELMIQVILGNWSGTSASASVIALGIIVPVILFIYKNKLNLARNYLVLALNALIFIFSSHVDLLSYRFKNLFFAMALLPFVLYSNTERAWRIFGVGLSVAMLLLVTIKDFVIPWSFNVPDPLWSPQATNILTLVLILLSVRIVLHFHDYTMKYLDEERARLINTDKLATLGELSSSLAHELKNPLAVIMSRTSLLQERLEMGPVSQEDLEKTLAVIMRTGTRIEQTIKSIQALSRDSTRDSLTPIPLRVLLEDVSILLDHKFKAKEVELRIVKYDPLWQVMGRESQLVQVLMNLISNAIDAVEGLESRWVEVEFLKDQHNFMIQVKDSGGGIDPEVVKKIMSPFFTTKVSGKGTGLGLSISKRIMKDHEGDLVYMPNQGNTVFHMQFPIKHLVSPQKKETLAA